MIEMDNKSKPTNPRRIESDEESDEEDKQTPTNNRRSQTRYVMTKPILSKFGESVMDYFRLPPRPTCLLGSLDQELLITHKKVRQRRTVAQDRADNEESRTKIKELDANSNENETNSTVREIERIHQCLEKLHRKLKGV